MKFPDDFTKHPHVMPNSFQWRARTKDDKPISVVAGGMGLNGDGITTFEIWYPDDDSPIGWQTIEEINERLKQYESGGNET